MKITIKPIETTTDRKNIAETEFLNIKFNTQIIIPNMWKKKVKSIYYSMSHSDKTNEIKLN